MRRRTKAIIVTFCVLGGFAMIIGDIPSSVLVERPTLAADSETITNSGVAVDGNVPAGVENGLDVPTAEGLKNGITDGLPPSASAGSSRVGAGNSGGGGGAAGTQDADAARREAEAREAAARRQAAEAEAEARAEAEAARQNAHDDSDDAEEDAREDAEDAEEDARDDAEDADD